MAEMGRKSKFPLITFGAGNKSLNDQNGIESENRREIFEFWTVVWSLENCFSAGGDG